jgi:hypothetical protein
LSQRKHRRTPRTRKKTWSRDIPDSILLCHSTRSALDRAESLNPDVSTIEKALGLEGGTGAQAAAAAIIAAWAPKFRITYQEVA